MLRSRTINLANPVNRKHPLNIGRVAWYLALPGLMGGAKWHDLMSPPDLRVGNHGTLTNIVQGPGSGWQGTNRPGGRGHLVFNGSNGIVRTPNPILMPAGGGLTISAWGYMASLASRTIAATYAAFPSNIQYTFRTDGSGFIQAFLETSGGANQLTATTAAATVNVWGHWACVYNDAAKTIAIYANGVAVGSTTYTGTPATATAVTTIGLTDNGSEPWSGGLDCIGIWYRALSTTAIAGLYDEERAGCPNTLNYFRQPYRKSGGLLLRRRREVIAA